MCNPGPRCSLEAKARRRCSLNDWHTVDTTTQFFNHPHELYRAAKAFYDKNLDCDIGMTIRISPVAVATSAGGE